MPMYHARRTTNVVMSNTPRHQIFARESVSSTSSMRITGTPSGSTITSKRYFRRRSQKSSPPSSSRRGSATFRTWMKWSRTRDRSSGRNGAANTGTLRWKIRIPDGRRKQRRLFSDIHRARDTRLMKVQICQKHILVPMEAGTTYESAPHT